MVKKVQIVKPHSQKVPDKIKKYVNRKLDEDVEDKVIRTEQLSPAAVSDVMTYIPLNICQTGAGLGNRIGQRIRLKELELKITAIINAAVLPGITTGRIFRVFVLYDKQSNGANPSNAQLLYNTTATDAVNSQFNIAGNKRYTILWHRYYTMHVEGGVANVARLLNIHKKIKLNKRLTVFNSGNAGTIGDINTGGLFLCMSCDADVIEEHATTMKFEDA